jgi:hypothetical protein
MVHIRLLNVCDSALETFELKKTPPYLAISHAWSDHIFAQQLPIDTSYGGKAIQSTLSNRFPSLRYCWIDNFCIKQDDDADKAEQIPLMGLIYRNAVAVLIVLSCQIGFQQSDVASATASMTSAMEMWIDETYHEEHNIRYWERGPDRLRLVQAMRGLSRLTRSTWATRIWTLQEYVLAAQVVWIGKDLQPITINDKFFQAIPGLCDQLQIIECLSRDPASEFGILHSHFSGMANSRLGDIDRTRIMELLGNRKATVPVDEVYGIMAASGVEIVPVPLETKEQAWERWCEAAITKGHIRWMMLPKASKTISATNLESNCVIPDFSLRHELSSRSMLDHVEPLGTTSVRNGTVTLRGHLVGSCQLIRKLGSVHWSKEGFCHRDITLILFSKGRWGLAFHLAEAFGAGRYDANRRKAIAQVMVLNYHKARQAVYNGHEERFAPSFTTSFQYKVWGDLMLLMSLSVMDPMNSGVAYLARITRILGTFSISLLVVIVLDGRTPLGLLQAIDFNAKTGDQRRILMITQEGADPDARSSLHKAGTTLPISGAYNNVFNMLPLLSFNVGGTRCTVCKDTKLHLAPCPKVRRSSVARKPDRGLRRREFALIRYLVHCSTPWDARPKRLISQRLQKLRKWRFIISILSSLSQSGSSGQ